LDLADRQLVNLIDDACPGPGFRSRAISARRQLHSWRTSAPRGCAGDRWPGNTSAIRSAHSSRRQGRSAHQAGSWRRPGRTQGAL